MHHRSIIPRSWREKSVIPWIIADVSGQIIIATAWLVWEKVAVMLLHYFGLLKLVFKSEILCMTVTQKKAYWVLPPSVKEIPYAPLSYINFHGKSQSSVSLSASPLNQPCTTSNLTSKTIECPSCVEMDHLFASLSTCSTKPAILSLVRNYCSNYIPNSLAPDMPMTFSDLFKPEYLSAGFADLLQIPVDVEIEVAPELWRRKQRAKLTVAYGIA